MLSGFRGWEEVKEDAQWLERLGRGKRGCLVALGFRV